MKKKHYSVEDISWTDVELKKEDVSQLILKYIYQFIIIYFGTLGTTLLVTSSLHFEIYNLSLVFSLLFLGLIPCITYNAKKRRFMSYLVVIGIFSVFIAIFSRQIITSGILVINKIIAEISVPYNLKLNQLIVPDLGVGNTNMILFILLFAFITLMITGYTVIVRHNIIVAMIIPIALFAFLLSFDVIPSTASVLFVVAYLLGVMSLENAPRLSPHPGIPIILGGIIISIFILIMLVVPKASYKRVGVFEGVRIWAMSSFDELHRYDNNSSILDDTSTGGVNGGELGKIDSINYKNNTMFNLTTTSISKNQYFRSFYGAEYSNNSWGEVPSSKNSQYDLMFINFDKINVDTNVQTSSLLKILGSSQVLQNSLKTAGFDYSQNVVKREFTLFYDKAQKKYWYLPYAADRTVDQKSSNDGYPQNNGAAYCAANYYSVSNPDYSVIKKYIDSYSGTLAEMVKYKTWESEYRKYVYDVYTELPETGAESIKAIAKNYSLTSETEKQAYIDMVIKYFANNYSYTLSPGKVPEGKDFVDYFMNESKKGYCTYFATAATLMFRAVGIPSRYVEGYCVTDNEIRRGEVSKGYSYTQNNGQIIESTYDKYTLPVYDNNAHAWVEIYKDGYGWVPVEVTPGVAYSSKQPSPSDTEQPPQQSDEQTQNETEEDIDKSTDESQNIGAGNYDQGLKGYGDWLASIHFNTVGLMASAIVFILLSAGIIWSVMYIKSRRMLMDLLSMKSGYDNRTQIFCIYQYLTKICRFLKVEKSETMDYEEYSILLKESSSFFAECNINDIMEIVLKARFGNSSVLESEALRITEEVAGLRDTVYQKSGWMSRIRFRYLNRL